MKIIKIILKIIYQVLLVIYGLLCITTITLFIPLFLVLYSNDKVKNFIEPTINYILKPTDKIIKE